MHKNNKAVFLDRDGVVCKEKSYITSSDQLEIFPFVIEAVRILKDAGWKVLIVTNQSAIARGMISEEELKIIHKKLTEAISLDGIYYCPHLPPYEGQVGKYFVNCNCRKPNPGMILQGARDHDIDLTVSYIVGDRLTDMLAGKKAGVKTVLVHTGYNEQDFIDQETVDFSFKDLKEFVVALIDKCRDK